MSKMIFINLPVADLGRSIAFYEGVGATKDERFCDGTAAMMVFSDAINVMLSETRVAWEQQAFVIPSHPRIVANAHGV